MEFEKIVSKDNGQFKFLKRLKQKKYRDELGLYLAEGRKFLDFSEVPKEIIIKEGELERHPHLKDKIYKIISKNRGIRAIVLSEQLFKELSSQENSQGIILVYNAKYSNIEEFSDDIVVLDRIGDPGNLGTIIRLCDASGFNNLILIKGSVDIYNEKVVRSAMGSLFGINFVYLETEKAMEYLKNKGYKIYVTSLQENSISYTKAVLSNKNAFVFGNEGEGVSKKIIESGNEKLIIPIYGMAESLNVAVASGILLYKMREKKEEMEIRKE